MTITDNYSRYLLACEGQESTKAFGAFAVFEAVFKEFGLPEKLFVVIMAHHSLRAMLYMA
ncbi:MAG: hypothetical protein COA94_07680 [Rickettsiales bacterium]|nr:MAG: hypothetical protein COA94_07680 [Rickettsiales bacterium]